VDCSFAGAASYLRDTAGHQMSARSVKGTALALALFVLAVFVGYIAWIGFHF
jgi:hypothetical protein